MPTPYPAPPSFVPELDTDTIYLLAAQSLAERPINLRGTNRGSFVGALVAWLNGRWQTLAFESRHELMTAYILLSTPGLTNLREQVYAPGFIGPDGKYHDHVFDFVATIDGKDHPIACKLVSSTDRLEFRSLLGAIKSQMGDFAEDITLVLESSFSRTRALNAELMHFIRWEKDDEADTAVAAVMADLIGVATISVIVAATGMKGRAWRSIVRQCARGEAVVASATRIDDYSTLICRNLVA